MSGFKAWVSDTAERAIWTGAQMVIALTAVVGFQWTTLSARTVFEAAGIAAGVCVLKQIPRPTAVSVGTVTLPAPIVVTTVNPAQPADLTTPPAATVSDLDDPLDNDGPDDSATPDPVAPQAPATTTT